MCENLLFVVVENTIFYSLEYYQANFRVDRSGIAPIKVHYYYYYYYRQLLFFLVQGKMLAVKTCTCRCNGTCVFLPPWCSSHWFLAVVCFPGLEGQEYISYQPAASQGEDVGPTGDSEVSHSTAPLAAR